MARRICDRRRVNTPNRNGMDYPRAYLYPLVENY